MGRPAGSINKDKQAIRDLAEKHGIDVVEVQLIIAADLLKTYNNEKGKPRSRRSKQFFTAEDKLTKLLEGLTPYVAGKLSNITVSDETPRLTVIRAPAPIHDSRAWLEANRPNQGDPSINDKPALPFATNLEDVLNTADALGVEDVAEIVDEAVKRTEDDVIASWNAKFKKGYD